MNTLFKICKLIYKFAFSGFGKRLIKTVFYIVVIFDYLILIPIMVFFFKKSLKKAFVKDFPKKIKRYFKKEFPTLVKNKALKTYPLSLLHDKFNRK